MANNLLPENRLLHNLAPYQSSTLDLELKNLVGAYFNIYIN